MSTETPVLSYANPRPDRPADTRLELEVFDDGLRFTDPPDPSRAKRARGMSIFFFGGAVVLPVLLYVFDRYRPSAQLFLQAILLSAMAIGLRYRARMLERYPFRVKARAGRVMTYYRGRAKPVVWPYEKVRKLHVTMPSRRLSDRREMSYLQIHSKWGGNITLLHNRPTDECRWVADLINHEVERTRAVSNDDDKSTS
jgi:hypothetical protein